MIVKNIQGRVETADSFVQEITNDVINAEPYLREMALHDFEDSLCSCAFCSIVKMTISRTIKKVAPVAANHCPQQSKGVTEAILVLDPLK